LGRVKNYLKEGSSMVLKSGRIRVSTCQFPVSPDLKRNSSRIQKQMLEAKRQRADVVHFPEGALSGYGGVDVKSWDGYNWDALKVETLKIASLAASEKLWVILGSAHPLSEGNLPHNSLYALSPKGRIVDRYDKRFCTGRDLKFYSPGDHFSVFSINGVRCGMLICYDVRFPELYREYKKLGVQCIFHSFYNARAKKPGIHKIIMRPSLQTRAATNYIWISASNSSAYYSWPSVLIQPDGVIAAQLHSNRPGVMTNLVDTDRKLYDASRAFRDLAMKGILHSGQLVSDPRSADRRSL
jgi:predicted amidohydrolase